MKVEWWSESGWCLVVKLLIKYLDFFQKLRTLEFVIFHYLHLCKRQQDETFAICDSIMAIDFWLSLLLPHLQLYWKFKGTAKGEPSYVLEAGKFAVSRSSSQTKYFHNKMRSGDWPLRTFRRMVHGGSFMIWDICYVGLAFGTDIAKPCFLYIFKFS